MFYSHHLDLILLKRDIVDISVIVFFKEINTKESSMK